MVKVKRELPDEPALPADPLHLLYDESAINRARADHLKWEGVDWTRRGPIEGDSVLAEAYSLNRERAEPASLDFDHVGAQLAPSPNVRPVLRQPPWSHPESGGKAPGPQHDYENEFQVPPPYWFPPPRLQPQPHGPMTLSDHEMTEFLKQQNKTSIEMAKHDYQSMGARCRRVWIPPLGWRESPLQDHQEQLKILEQQFKTRLAMVRGDNPSPPSPPATTGPIRLMHSGVNPPPHPPGGAHLAKDDYQIQLMLLEQQNKKRLMMARQEKVLMSSQSTQFTPETTPGDREQSVANDAYNAYQIQLILLDQQNKKRLLMAKQKQEAFSSQSSQFTPETTSGDRKQSVANDVYNEYQMQLMLLEQENKKRLLMAKQKQKAMLSRSPQFTPESTLGFQEAQEPSTAGLNHIQLRFMESHPNGSVLSHYSHQPSRHCTSSGWMERDHDQQLAILEQQKQARAIQAQQEGNYINPSSVLQYYQEQQMLKEQEDRKRMRREMQIKEEAGPWGPPATSLGNHALQDYQMQLMLSEHQNKKRAMAARQTNPNPAVTPPTHNHTLQDYQMQLMLLEQANKEKAKMPLIWLQENDSRPPTSADGTTGQVSETEQEDSHGKARVASRGAKVHKRPLVVRERPTCDD